MLCDKLKEIRKKNNLNKSQMAKKLDVPYTTYNNYETGSREPGSTFLIKFSQMFDISIDYLMGIYNDNSDEIIAYKKNDTIADIILKIRTDNELLEIIKGICELPAEQRTVIQTLLSAFNNNM